MTIKHFKQINILNTALIVLGAVFFIIDIIAKKAALSGNLPDLNLFNLISLELTKNQYIAFSLPFKGKWLELAIMIIIVVMSILAIRLSAPSEKTRRNTIAIAMGLIIIGALGNLIDRFSYDYVIDYIDIKNLMSFNLADVLITLPTLGIIIYTIFNKKEE